MQPLAQFQIERVDDAHDRGRRRRPHRFLYGPQGFLAMRGLDQTLHDSHQVDNIINGVGDFFNPGKNAIVQAPVGFERYCQDALGNVLGSNAGQITPNCQLLTPVQ